MEEKSEPCKVLLASVTNLMYPVDIDLMHFLFSKYGQVEKIVTFSKSPTMYQALVQFAFPDQAKQAMVQLHNRNIYDGCNTLQIQASRLPELVVKSNSTKSWDYTSEMGNGRNSSGYGGGGVGLLNTPGNSMSMGPAGGGFAGQPGGMGMGGPQMGMGSGPMGGGYGSGMGGSMGASMTRSTQAALLSMMDKLPKELRELNLESTNSQQTPVVICYNLSPTDTTVQQLFNLFSLYGTVLRIKILREKTDTALIQFSEPLYASIAHALLNNAPINGRELQISFSKNHEVKLRRMPPQSNQEAEEDVKRTMSFTLKDQRYGLVGSLQGDMEKYVKGACRPTSTLFIANIHEDCSQEDVTKLFAEFSQIGKFQFRPPREGSRTRMAIVELASEVDAIRALMHLHNTPLNGRNIKVAFSKTVLAA
eukprot:GHVQ01023287.1.p1 GENE.GHVQ01023287.1~~GHVQ01023287.1.p1  ORF type:complete len:421 (-),score=38.60 GHVQ01023287.1:936-2198(-)